ncbi:MAG: DUF547 domain-containing protein [Flavobacteriaceae bacterium]
MTHFLFTTVFGVCLSIIISCSSTKHSVSEASRSPEIIIDTVTTFEKADTISPKVTTPIITKSETDSINVINEQFDHSIFNNLLNKHVTDNGNTNYSGFIDDKKIFKRYLTALSENPPQESWTKEDTLAYWMNVYNAFTIKLITDNYPTESIKNIKDAWSSRFFKIGRKWYNLQDVEHKILRKMNDPRIHFGINCASFSCPPLLNRAFTAATVNTDLDFLAHRFINDKTRNTISENNIQLSKIFKWYASDFKTDGTLIDYLNKYSEVIINKNTKRSFKNYDWSLND